MTKETVDFSRFTPGVYTSGTNAQYDFTVAIFRRFGLDPTELRPTNYQDMPTTNLLANFFKNSGVDLDTNLGQLIHMLGLEQKLRNFLTAQNAHRGNIPTILSETESLLQKTVLATQQLGDQIFHEAAQNELASLRSTLFPSLGRGRLQRSTSLRKGREEMLATKIADIRTRFPPTSR